jgi:protein-L-isoaspartate(D-aspartate) O-methyltransferase
MTQAWKIFLPALSLCFTLLSQSPAKSADTYRYAREQLVREIEMDVKKTSLHLKKSKLDSRVLDAMRSVPRHKFVPRRIRDRSYDNRPLPIGHGQTISQPYIVAIMTDLLSVDKESKVLEVGTGSGYQAAILAEIVKEVYTIEIIEPLGKSAKKRLSELGYANIHVRLADGYYGWQDKGPFDAIVVTAAASHIPPPLIRQLKPGGTMIIPVGGQFMVQHLVLVEKDTDGSTKTRQLLPVRFVPLTGKH